MTIERYHKRGERGKAHQLEKASYDTVHWQYIGTITATDYIQLGALPQDCKIVAVYAGAESCDFTTEDETYKLDLYKDDACDAAAGTTVITQLTITGSTDDGVVKTATVDSAGDEYVDVSATPMLKAKYTLAGTTPVMTNPWITVVVKYIEQIGVI